ncbi:hypothetical protein [Neisseria sp.]|uniref:hypothetical protein n=1 Tax=Neisseria sp. TaxID=192066 RepID=UPI00359FEBEC
MMAFDSDILTALVYAAVFAAAAIRAKQWPWLLGCILLWLVVNAAGMLFLGVRSDGLLAPSTGGMAEIKPEGLWYFGHPLSLVAPQLYIVPASLLYFKKTAWQRNGEASYRAAGGAFIGLFAVTGALSAAALLLIAATVWYAYPTGNTAYAASAMLYLFVLKPVFWILIQATLMIVFYIHSQKIKGIPADNFSPAQLKAGFLLSLLLAGISIVGAMALVWLRQAA